MQSNFGLTSERISAMVTDNGSNFVKCFRMFGIDSLTLPDGEVVSLVNEDGTEENDDIDDLLNFFHDITWGERDEDGNYHDLPKHKRCASHTLSLICTTDIKEVFKNLSRNEKKVHR